MKHVKFIDNRSTLTKIADSTEFLSNLIKKYWHFILLIICFGIVGKMDFEDQICKNPNSEQCIQYKNDSK